MPPKLIVILQISVLCWNTIDVRCESPRRAFLENDVFSLNESDSYSTTTAEIYDEFDFHSTDFNDTTWAVENLKVEQTYPDALEVSWIVTGTNVTKFLIKWFANDLPIGSGSLTSESSKEKFSYRITKLEACTEYKVVVTSAHPVDAALEAEHVIGTTAETQPGAPLILTADPCDFNGTLALNVSWQRPKVGGFCVAKYAVSVDATIYDKRHFLTKNTSDTYINMKHLHACTSYLVTVKAVGTNDTYGLSATIQSKPTSRKVSEKPRLINSQTLPAFVSNTTSIIFNWYVFDENNNCTIESVTTACEYSRSNGYGYDLKDGESNRTIDGSNARKIKLIVDRLSPYTLYICYGRIVNQAGTSNKSLPVWVLTMEDAPSAPQNLKLVNESTLTFSWEPPAYMPGRLQKYKIVFSWVPRYVVPDFCDAKRQYIIDGIDRNASTYTWNDGDGFSNYNVDIAAYTKGGWSRGNGSSIAFQTYARRVPDKVTKLQYETKPQANDSNVLQTTLSWSLPCSLRGQLKHFEVFVFGTKNHLANHTMRHSVKVPRDYDKNMRFSIVLGELRPQHLYKFHVSAAIREIDETGEVAVCETEYPAGIPPVPSQAEMDMIKLKPNKMPRSTTSIEVLLPLFNNTNGDIQFYAIIVSRLGFKYERAHTRFNLDDEKVWPNISSWKEAVEVDFEIPYQVTEPRWVPYPNYIINYGSIKAVKYVIGEDVTCYALSSVSRLYCNGPLKADTTYQVWMRAFTNGGYSDSDYVLVVTDKEVSIYLIIGAILGILLVGIIAAVILTKMSHYKGVKNPFHEEESDLESYRNRRQPINSNPGGHESATAPTRTRRRIDQSNEQN